MCPLPSNPGWLPKALLLRKPARHHEQEVRQPIEPSAYARIRQGRFAIGQPPKRPLGPSHHRPCHVAARRRLAAAWKDELGKRRQRLVQAHRHFLNASGLSLPVDSRAPRRHSRPCIKQSRLNKRQLPPIIHRASGKQPKEAVRFIKRTHHIDRHIVLGMPSPIRQRGPARIPGTSGHAIYPIASDCGVSKGFRVRYRNQSRTQCGICNTGVERIAQGASMRVFALAFALALAGTAAPIGAATADGGHSRHPH